MSNSKLVTYTRTSPNKTSPRNHAIDTITIHCAAGNCSIETLGAIFAPASRRACSNYGVGTDGRIGMYCDETDRSWCTSNRENDQRAITIEVANDGGAPDWHVSDKALAALIDLCADICRRNGIKKLVWSTDKNSRMNHLNGCNMTVHRDYANKACPGDYLYSKHGYIADEVNKHLGALTTEDPQPVAFLPYAVKVTANCLNCRSGPSVNFSIKGTLKNGEVHTVVAEARGRGATLWGELEYDAGWISLDYVKREVVPECSR